VSALTLFLRILGFQSRPSSRSSSYRHQKDREQSLYLAWLSLTDCPQSARTKASKRKIAMGDAKDNTSVASRSLKPPPAEDDLVRPRSKRAKTRVATTETRPVAKRTKTVAKVDPDAGKKVRVSFSNYNRA
jgi:hypothetical protein